MKIIHIVIAAKYVEGFSYQENILPLKHKQAGNEVYILTSPFAVNSESKVYYNTPRRYINDAGIEVTILDYRTRSTILQWFLGRCRGVYEYLCEKSPDIIFVHGAQCRDVVKVVRYKKMNPSVRLFADQHGDYYNSPINSIKTYLRKEILAKPMARLLARYVEVYWGVTPWRVLYLREVYGILSDKTDLLIMGGDEDKIDWKNRGSIRSEIRDKYTIPHDSFLIVTGGKIDKRKNQDLLMEVVKQLADQNIFLIVFGSPTEEMRPIFETYSNFRNIKLIGWLPSDEAYNIFLASDLAMFPGTHSVLWEQAVACGVPSIFKYWEGMTHVNMGGNAILMQQIDVEHIREVIIELNGTKKYKQMKFVAEKIRHYFLYGEIAKKSICDQV